MYQDVLIKVDAMLNTQNRNYTNSYFFGWKALGGVVLTQEKQAKQPPPPPPSQQNYRTELSCWEATDLITADIIILKHFTELPFWCYAPIN